MTATFTPPSIEPLDQTTLGHIWAQLDDKTKPPRSLGLLEDTAARLFTIRPTSREPRAAVVVFAADHGVVDEGVSAYPQEVTVQMLRNFAAGGAAINALCASAGAELIVVDVGSSGPTPAGVRDENIRRGSDNLARGPALTENEVHQALEVGMRLATELADAGHDIVGLGEMGIGNTTVASALTAALLRAPVEQVVGRGTGINDARLAHKRLVIARALERHAAARSASDWLCRVGGLEIAALCGLVLGAAHRKLAIVLDGFITTAAAVVAAAMAPTCKEYCFASHLSTEPGHAVALRALGLRPLLQLDLRLGEGSGAALSLPLFRAAAHIYHDMATFESAEVSRQGE